MSAGVNAPPSPAAAATTVPDADAPEQVEWAGKFVRALRRGGWEYAGRAGGITAAVILALDAGDVLLVEQYRVPVGKRCIELPAGLIGDDHHDESPLAAAARDLKEETGYRAETLEDMGEFYSSTGMLTESFTLVKATGLTRVGPGGGTDHEDIVVHRVPLAQMGSFIAAQRALGHGVDAKIMMLLSGTLLERPTA
ncbi:MAG: ADP-ribose pyrophosphatase [Pseudomonadota bacterium]|jgi:ADP-ribose pyrophosphatase